MIYSVPLRTMRCITYSTSTLFTVNIIIVLFVFYSFFPTNVQAKSIQTVFARYLVTNSDKNQKFFALPRGPQVANFQNSGKIVDYICTY